MRGLIFLTTLSDICAGPEFCLRCVGKGEADCLRNGKKVVSKIFLLIRMLREMEGVEN